MNRITAVLLAMAALLVHVLAIHRDLAGDLAHPFEGAHVAFELGISLADTGEATWRAPDGQATGDLSSHPSPLLVWLSALLQLLSMNVVRAAQLVGVLCALATVFLSTRFDTDRIAGVIPALLLVSSGAVAATGASGTEWPLAMVALLTSFVALEHGRARFAAIGLALLVLSCAAGAVAAVALFAQTLMRRINPSAGDPAAPLWPFPVAALAFVMAHFAGAGLVEQLGIPFGPSAAAAREQGWLELLDHLVATVTPVLLVFPVLGLLRGRLSAEGRRALGMTVTWAATIVLLGGGPSPYGLAYAPALPLAFMAIQQGMARVLDTYLRSMERLVWASLTLAIMGALLASRFPGDFGRLALRAAHERAFAMRAAPDFGGGAILGRAALYDEIRRVGQLEEIAELLDKRLAPGTTILSPWPGTLGRRTKLTVIDAFGRTAALPGAERASWTPRPGTFDTRAAFRSEPDLILPSIAGIRAYETGELEDLLPAELLALDPDDGDALRIELSAALTRYEPLVTVGEGTDSALLDPLLLLKKRGLGEPLALAREDVQGRIRVTVEHPSDGSSAKSVKEWPGLNQVFDVLIEGILEDGSAIALSPNGELHIGEGPSLRGVLQDPRWQGPTTLAELDRNQLAMLPQVPVEVRVRLLHHRFRQDDPRANAASPLQFGLSIR